MAGQGLNQALRDVAFLAAALAGVGDPGDPALLARWRARRERDRRITASATDLLVTLFSNDAAPLAALRGAGLLALDLLPPLRRAFARRSMGLGLGVPLPMRRRFFCVRGRCLTWGRSFANRIWRLL